MKLAAGQAHRLFDYNAATGEVTRRVTVGYQAKAGDIAGYTAGADPHLRIGIAGKLYLLHRVIWLMVYGEWPGEVDHINGDASDNRLVNLRDVTHEENGRNQRLRSNNQSGALGVCWHKGSRKWRAVIVVNNKQIHIGMFADKVDAMAARKSAEKKYGFHNNHGRQHESA